MKERDGNWDGSLFQAQNLEIRTAPISNFYQKKGGNKNVKRKTIRRHENINERQKRN